MQSFTNEREWARSSAFTRTHLNDLYASCVYIIKIVCISPFRIIQRWLICIFTVYVVALSRRTKQWTHDALKLIQLLLLFRETNPHIGDTRQDECYSEVCVWRWIYNYNTMWCNNWKALSLIEDVSWYMSASYFYLLSYITCLHALMFKKLFIVLILSVLQHLFSPSVWNQSPVCSDWFAGRLCCDWSTAYVAFTRSSSVLERFLVQLQLPALFTPHRAGAVLHRCLIVCAIM